MQHQAQQETRRSNLANESIRRASNAIQQHQAETQRLNYYVNLQNANTNARNASVNEYNAETSRLSHYESQRHNLASEQEMNRSNLANESIRRDANNINYSLGVGNLNLRQQEISNNYQLGLGNLAVAQRNAATQQRIANETERSNRAIESLKAITQQQQFTLGQRANSIQQQVADQNYKVNLRRTEEQIRHNKASERNDQRQTASQNIRRMTQNVNDSFGTIVKLIDLFM